MGEVIDLTRYRANAKGNSGNWLNIEITPPAFFVQYFENGELKIHYRVISERMIRDLLDELE